MPLYVCKFRSKILYAVTDEGQFSKYLDEKFYLGLIDPNDVDEINQLIDADWDGDYHVKIVEI